MCVMRVRVEGGMIVVVCVHIHLCVCMCECLVALQGLSSCVSTIWDRLLFLKYILVKLKSALSNSGYVCMM